MGNPKTNPRINDKDFRDLSFGGKGFVVTTAGNVDTSHEYVAITALTNTDVTLTQKNIAGATPQTLTLSVGTTIYGRFDPITGVTGTIISYIG